MDPDSSQVSSFPLPPLEYVGKYSNQSLANDLAPPPPPPLEGHYTMFGEAFNTEDEIIQPLESQGIRQLYSTGVDPRQELKRLTRSLVAAFLDLLEIIIRYPDSPERQKKLEDLRLLFINTHHLINEYRPHQARETLQLMLAVQKSERLATVERFSQHFDSVRSMLAQCLSEIPNDLQMSPDLQERVRAALRAKSTVPDHCGNLSDQLVADRDKLMCDLAK